MSMTPSEIARSLIPAVRRMLGKPLSSLFRFLKSPPSRICDEPDCDRPAVTMGKCEECSEGWIV